MSKAKSERQLEKTKDESIFVEGEFFHDSIGVGYFLPPEEEVHEL